MRKSFYLALALALGLTGIAQAAPQDSPDDGKAKAAVRENKDTAKDADKDAPKPTADKAKEAVKDTREAAKDTAKSTAEAAKDAAKSTQDAAKDTAQTAADKARDTAKTATDKSRDTARDAREGARDTRDAARDTARDSARDARDARDRARDSTGEAADKARDVVRETRDAVRDTARDVGRDVRDTARDARDAARDVGRDVRDSVRDARDNIRGRYTARRFTSNFGIRFSDRDTKNLTISTVEAGSVLYKAGFRDGDRIVRVGDHRVTTADDFVRYLYAVEGDDRIEVIVLRDDVEEIIYVEPKVLIIEDRPAVAAAPVWLGVFFDDRARAVVIREVVPGSPAARAGLRAGDVILSIKGKKMARHAEVTEFVRTLRDGETATLEIERDRRAMDLDVTFVTRAAARATTTPDERREIREDRRGVREDRRDERRDTRDERREVRDDVRDARDARDTPREAVREERREVRDDARDAARDANRPAERREGGPIRSVLPGGRR